MRDSDGLALSSRNAYLTPNQRSAALALPRALQRARDAIERGGAVSEALAAGRDALTEAGFGRIDYFALVESHTLEPISEVRGEMRLIAAATIGGTRLIDNLAVQLQQLGA